MDKNYIVIDKETGRVKNIIVWNGVSPYELSNAILINADLVPREVGFGYKKENNKWFRFEYNEETNEETWTEVVQ
jgi:hypothetical protein